MQNKQMELLVSVRNLTEAKIAKAANVDIIDIKEPLNGSLGAASLNVISTIAKALPDASISAALGEIGEYEQLLGADNASLPFEKGLLTYAKCGLANSIDSRRSQEWKSRAKTAWKKIATFANPVAVAYADFEAAKCPEPVAILEQAIACNVNVLLIDTFLKDGHTSLDHIKPNALLQIINLANRFGVKTVIAGSITKPNLSQLAELEIDCVAVRGAVCSGKRTEELSANLLEDFLVAMIEATQTTSKATRATKTA